MRYIAQGARMNKQGFVTAVVIAASWFTTTPHAQPWPSRPVRMLLPYAPGGGVDIVARTLAQKLSEQMGASFVVENRPGGTGIVATELVARATPDGHTLLLSATEFGINPAVRAK